MLINFGTPHKFDIDQQWMAEITRGIYTKFNSEAVQLLVSRENE